MQARGSPTPAWLAFPLARRNDPELACRLWSRADLPRERLLRLVEGASREVIARLVESDDSKAELFRDLVAEAAKRVRDASDTIPGSMRPLSPASKILNRAGKLDEARPETVRGGKRV